MVTEIEFGCTPLKFILDYSSFIQWPRNMMPSHPSLTDAFKKLRNVNYNNVTDLISVTQDQTKLYLQ